MFQVCLFNARQRFVYVACATVVVLKTEDSEKAKRTDYSPLKVEFLTHFYEYEELPEL